MLDIGTKFTFHSPYQYGPDGWTDEEFTARKGTEAEVVGHMTVENGPHEGWDDEALPVYRVRFTSDDVAIIAWPEEVEDEENN